jgi:hypothetical protein
MRAAATLLDGDLAGIGVRQSAAVDALERAVFWIVDNFSSDPKAAHVGAVPFLHLLGILLPGVGKWAGRQSLPGRKLRWMTVIHSGLPSW